MKMMLNFSQNGLRKAQPLQGSRTHVEHALSADSARKSQNRHLDFVHWIYPPVRNRESCAVSLQFSKNETSATRHIPIVPKVNGN